MQVSIYSEKYLQFQLELNKLQSKFDSTPNKKTATALSDFRNSKAFSEKEMYTEEHFKTLSVKRNNNEKQMWVELWGYMSDARL